MPDFQNRNPQKNNPLHGVKLADLLERLVNDLGWPALAEQVDINCFKNDPSIKSSLKFLRRTPWARNKVEQLYLQHIGAAVPERGPKASAGRTSASRTSAGHTSAGRTSAGHTRQPKALQQQIWGAAPSKPTEK